MNTEQFSEKLRKNGYKVTPQRLAIFELIFLSRDHPTAEQIHQEVTKNFPSMSLSTVYQVLHLLEELGQIQELKFTNKSSRYETDISPHINALCPKCGKIDDYYSETVIKFWTKITEEFEFKPLNQRIDVYRYCDICKELIDGSEKNKID